MTKTLHRSTSSTLEIWTIGLLVLSVVPGSGCLGDRNDQHDQIDEATNSGQIAKKHTRIRCQHRRMRADASNGGRCL